MADPAESDLHGPQAFALARQALDDMERRGIWPTPLNYELWIQALIDPSCGLATEIERLFSAGQPVTDLVCEALAVDYLPKARLKDQIRDTGDRLNRELAEVAQVIKQAHESSEQYGQTLAGAGRELSGPVGAEAIGKLVETLAEATREAQHETRSLEERLEESTAEITRLRGHLEQVQRDATIDGLTNLANRKAFDDAQDQACDMARANAEPLMLAVLDIDHFKIFNDTWGHQTGDQVLRYVASVIARLSPSPRFAARYGGEEFAVIFPGEKSRAVLQTLEEIRLEICSRALKRRSTNEDLGSISISAGLAHFRPAEDVASLIERADEALYASKHTGRNCVTVAPSMPNAA